jgi:hypothetical protein
MLMSCHTDHYTATFQQKKEQKQALAYVANLKIEYHCEEGAHIQPLGKQTANELGKLYALSVI